MKKILGLDLGTTSIGWALVNEKENDTERSSIIKLGVRVNPLTVDEQTNFEKGRPITTNADRTLKRSMRRNLQRYKLRRESLVQVLNSAHIITDETLLSEQGNHSTFKTYEYRAKAATEQIPLEEFAKVLLMINKKRGYKSSRKAKNEDEGQLIDGMEVAKQLYENDLTPGQLVYENLCKGKKFIPDFYRSDLMLEFDKIWTFQSKHYPEIFNATNRERIVGQNRRTTADFFEKELKIDRVNLTGNFAEKKLHRYEFRSKSLTERMPLDEISEALIEINNDVNNSSGYLGAIGDRSKELHFNKQTVGQYLWDQISKDPHTRLKGQVFYRQDYLDEFETIWNKQAEFHKHLTNELKAEIRDIIIFYQRRLKSQKGLISFCEFEQHNKEIIIDGKKKQKIIGLKVCPKSSPLFQEFKIWQILNNLEVSEKKGKGKWELELEHKKTLFDELNIIPKLSKDKALRILGLKPSEYDLNFKELEGNRTNAAFYETWYKIGELSGHDEIDFEKLNAHEKKEALTQIFELLGINKEILSFNALIQGEELEKQHFFQLWHLLYSYEGDNSNTGNEKLKLALEEKFGIPKEFTGLVSNISLQPDYGSLSAKAIRKTLPFLLDGNKYDLACVYAGYNHSKSATKEQNEQRVLKDKLDILSKNSLRNPVVEKILNQMINVINAIIEEYGKPEEIRIEMSRELKKNAKERKELTESINKSNDEHKRISDYLRAKYGFSNVSRNDIIRYKLYKELEYRGYKTLYSNTYIPEEKIFSKDFDIEHIIPQSRLFDDSFSNKTLELRSINIEKGDATAFDYIKQKYGIEAISEYVARIEELFKNGRISMGKKRKLLMAGVEIPEDFIQRDLRDSQYIAKKAKSLLEEVFRSVNTTTGSITNRLRDDWQLVHVMQELNWNKYKILGLTEEFTNKEGQIVRRIKDWTKRNDHRHHAMDALTVAFTKRNHVHYLNNLNARSDKSSSIYGIEQKELYRDARGQLKFKPPIPLDDFRAEAKKHLESTLVSFKAKNKVVTKNNNKIRIKKGHLTKTELTPRGQLHLETVYGKINRYKTTEVKIGSNFDEATINKVAVKHYREALLQRLKENGNDPKKAFTGSNSLEKKPLYLNPLQTEKIPERIRLVEFESTYTIRKDITPDLKIDKVIDSKIKEVLEERLKAYNDDAKKAFSNLEENPIWLNKEKGISVKRVTISGISNAASLHFKKDKEGSYITDVNGKKIETDFVNTGNNHHVAIYRDAKGVLQESVVSFFEVVERVNQGQPIIDKHYNHSEGWQYLFTMKQNEYFVFPNEITGFNPNNIDLLNPDNNILISPNLFRVQKITSKDYFFRHHLETTVENNGLTKELNWKRVGINGIGSCAKIRINHLGQVVSVGEY
jgi:CRISPR-associated endonuclease Csn1